MKVEIQHSDNERLNAEELAALIEQRYQVRPTMVINNIQAEPR